LNADRVAQRFAERPGFALASYGEVGLPFFRVQVRALVLEKKPVGPFAEFTLRAVANGITQLPQIGEFLGLDQVVLEQTVADLLAAGDLSLRAASGVTPSSLQLTEKGRRTLAEADQVQPAEHLLEIDFDALLRKPYLYVDGLVTPRELRERGAREIPPSPSRRPEVGDIDIVALRRIVQEYAERRQIRADLLGVTSLGERHSYFLPAVLLVYQSLHSADVQVGFAMSGRISPEHEAAFAHARLRKRFVLGGEGGPSAEEVAAQLLGKDLVEKADRGDVLRLQGVIANALAVSEGQEVDPALAAEAAVAEEQLRALPVRPLETYEHPKYLRDALATSSQRLLIISPWLRRAVVDRQFVADLERLLSQNVDVYIGWGISKTEMERDADASVRADLDRLAARHQNFRFVWLGDTHAKVLLSDDRFVIVGSFNWLSFQGDPGKTFRDERGMFVAIPLVIEEQFNLLAARFSSTVAAAPAAVPPPAARRVFSP
jgi:hypothetical protein